MERVSIWLLNQWWFISISLVIKKKSDLLKIYNSDFFLCPTHLDKGENIFWKFVYWKRYWDGRTKQQWFEAFRGRLWSVLVKEQQWKPWSKWIKIELHWEFGSRGKSLSLNRHIFGRVLFFLEVSMSSFSECVCNICVFTHTICGHFSTGWAKVGI